MMTPSPHSCAIATQRLLAGLVLLVLVGTGHAQAPSSGNLLRNSRFQDDWLTLLPELKTLNWNYVMDFYHRRDFNPDGWDLKGNWTWDNADAPHGQRRLILQGPQATLTQDVNAWGVHDPKQLAGSPDTGGYPALVAVGSPEAKRLLRDLTLRVRLRGQDVPDRGGTVEAAWVPAQGAPVAVSVPLPTGTFDFKDVELKLPASLWWEK